MGAYINPKDKTKEAWLKENAEVCKNPYNVPEGWLPICLVDNGLFTAAGIGYSQREVQVFMTPDGRHKTWWMAKIEDLHLVSPELKNYLGF